MPDRPRLLLAAVVVALAAAAVVLLLNDSALLPGTHSDGVEYTAAAESLATRGTLEIPVASWGSADSTSTLSHYPPGFSLAIGGVQRVTGVPNHVATLWTVALGAALSTGLAFVIAASLGGWAGGAVAVGLLLPSTSWILLHIAVWSEALYLGFALALLLATVARPRAALLHGVLAAAGVMVRYAGVAGVGLAAVTTWRANPTSRDRARALLAAVGPSVVLVAFWGRFLSGAEESARRIGWYPGIGIELRALVDLTAAWFVPRGVLGMTGSLGGLVLLGVVGGGMAGWALAIRRRAGLSLSSADLLPRALLHAAIFALLWIAVVVASRLFADPRIQFDDRIFAPVLLLGTLAIAVAVGRLVAHRSTRLLGVAAMALLAAGQVVALRDAAGFVPFFQAQGRFYTATVWPQDAGLRWVAAETEEDHFLYSNEAHLVAFRVGRSARSLPIYGEDFDAFAEAWRERPGPVLLARPIKAADLPEGLLTSLIEVEVLMRTPNTVVYLPVGDPRLSSTRRP